MEKKLDVLSVAKLSLLASNFFKPKLERIYIDIDGVMVDFITGALATTKLSKTKQSTYKYTPELSLEKFLGLTRAEFVEHIDLIGPEFWINLPIIPQGIVLLNSISHIKAERVFLTDPSTFAHSFAGKRKWFSKAGKFMADKIVITEHKHLLANKNSILIDDLTSNCKKWRENKGVAYQFPAIKDLKDPMDLGEFQYELNKFKCL